MRRERTLAALLVAGFTAVACGPIEPVDPVAKSAESVVRIAGTACLRPILASGFPHGDGVVITVAHAIAGADEDVHVVDGQGNRYEPTVVAFDPNLDLAVLEVPGLDAAALQPADAEAGDTGVIAAFGREDAVELIDYEVLRLVNARSGDIYDEGRVERDALDVRSPAEVGSSGAPLLDAEGHYVGMVFAISRDRPDGVFAVTSGEIEAFLDGVDTAVPAERGRCR